MTTLEMLQIEFKGPVAPLAAISVKYLGVGIRKAGDQAKAGVFPIPCHRLGTQKSPWLVSLVDLASLIDSKADAARTDWEENHLQEWPIPRTEKR